MRRSLLFLFVLLGLVPGTQCLADESLFSFYNPHRDPLAARDEFGLLHQMPGLYPTDFAPRHAMRLSYYFESEEVLVRDPAYVGALQVALRSHGYYCGPIDGVFSPRVSEAIAHMQKNFSLRVTGTLTLGVRRGLHLP